MYRCHWYPLSLLNSYIVSFQSWHIHKIIRNLDLNVEVNAI